MIAARVGGVDNRDGCGCVESARGIFVSPSQFHCESKSSLKIVLKNNRRDFRSIVYNLSPQETRKRRESKPKGKKRKELTRKKRLK